MIPAETGSWSGTFLLITFMPISPGPHAEITTTDGIVDQAAGKNRQFLQRPRPARGLELGNSRRRRGGKAVSGRTRIGTFLKAMRATLLARATGEHTLDSSPGHEGLGLD